MLEFSVFVLFPRQSIEICFLVGMALAVPMNIVIRCLLSYHYNCLCTHMLSPSGFSGQQEIHTQLTDTQVDHPPVQQPL